jgi:HEAT repeat protein
VQALVHGLESNFLSTRKVVAGALDRLRWKPQNLYQQILFLSAKDDWVGLVRLKRHGIASLTRELQERQAAERGSIAEALKVVGNLATEPLVRLLENPDPDIRWRAASLLGDGRDMRAVGPLVAALEDADERVSGSVAIALGEIGDEAAVDPLIRAFTTGSADLRNRSVIALGKIRSKRAFATIVAASGDDDYEVRLSAIRAMWSIRDARMLPVLLPFFQDPDPAVRMETIRALGSYPLTGTVDCLIRALDDPDAGIRKEASGVLGKRNAVAAVRPLVALLGDPDTGVRLSAAGALDAIGWKPVDAREELAYLIAKEDWTEIRRRGLISNPFTKSSNPKPFLVPEDAPVGVSETPGVAAREQAGPDDKLVNPEPWVRSPPSSTGDEVPDLHVLIKALADPHADPRLRLRAAEALGKLGDLRGVQPLMNALRDPEAEIRWRAALSLGMLGDHRAFSALVVALDDPVFEVKRRAAESIAALKPGGVFRPLRELLKSPDPGTPLLLSQLSVNSKMMQRCAPCSQYWRMDMPTSDRPRCHPYSNWPVTGVHAYRFT